MERISKNLNHSRISFIFSISKGFERASFYGFRSVLIIYMTSEIIGMERTEALGNYALFMSGITISSVIGALLGDLLIGNRMGTFMGGVLQMLGMFILMLSDQTSLFIGLILIIAGVGLYSANTLAQMGKGYIQKPQLADSGFTIFFMAISAGSFVGSLMMEWIGNLHFRVVFASAGFLMIFALIPLFWTKNQLIEQKENVAGNSKICLGIILFFIFLSSLYWLSYELSFESIYRGILVIVKESEGAFLSSDYEFPKVVSLIFFGLLASVLWSYYFYNQVVKVIVAVFFLVLAIVLLLPGYYSESENYGAFVLSIIFLGISETHISPVLYSVVLKYANTKYLAIIYSLVKIPESLLFYFIYSLAVRDTASELTIGYVVLGILLIASLLTAYFFFYSKRRLVREVKSYFNN